MNSPNTRDCGPAQWRKLQEVIRELKDRSRLGSESPLDVRNRAIQLQILATPLVPASIADRLHALELHVNDVASHDWSKVEAELDGIVPLIEDALEFNRLHPNPDLPEDIQRDFREAEAIREVSPRSAAALLRLCIQKLCKHLGESGTNLYRDIEALTLKGLNPSIKTALHSVRVIGSQAVFPGQIYYEDDGDTASSLLGLANMIADAMITQPRKVDELLGAVPEGKQEDTARQDSEPPSFSHLFVAPSKRGSGGRI